MFCCLWLVSTRHFRTRAAVLQQCFPQHSCQTGPFAHCNSKWKVKAIVQQAKTAFRSRKPWQALPGAKWQVRAGWQICLQGNTQRTTIVPFCPVLKDPALQSLHFSCQPSFSLSSSACPTLRTENHPYVVLQGGAMCTSIAHHCRSQMHPPLFMENIASRHMQDGHNAPDLCFTCDVL